MIPSAPLLEDQLFCTKVNLSGVPRVKSKSTIFVVLSVLPCWLVFKYWACLSLPWRLCRKMSAHGMAYESYSFGTCPRLQSPFIKVSFPHFPSFFSFSLPSVSWFDFTVIEHLSFRVFEVAGFPSVSFRIPDAHKGCTQIEQVSQRVTFFFLGSFSLFSLFYNMLECLLWSCFW